MNLRQLSLLEYHRGLGDFAVTPNEPSFFILDLDDPTGRDIAASIKGAPDLEAYRASLTEGQIPSLTITLTLGVMNALIETGWNLSAKPAPPSNMFYIVIVSGGVVIALLPKELNQ